MERGVYFDAWFPRQHCYHPSLPPRRLRMVDDLVDYRASVLVWSAMGGGSLACRTSSRRRSAPVEPRARFYGFVNDSEFIAECHKHGIKVFGIVFEAQGWEFPVELNDDEDEILALNELRGVGHRDWLGLREFSPNRYPKLWPPFEHYFPGGLVNSDGEQVTDLIDECVARDIHQEPCHAHWVECPDRDHQCFYMDRNNPVWREYLKAVIRIQIDAGVDGIQLDEAELPMGAFQYGACFCKDCMKGFRAYLQALRPSAVDIELDGVDLETFHYGEWLLGAGYDFKDDREATPLFGDYYRYQCRAIKTHFAELADYAREYGRDGGRDVLVSGNFFNLRPALSRARRRRRPDHHRDAQHDLPPAGLVPLRARASPATRTSWSSRTRTAASCPSWSTCSPRARARPAPAVALRGRGVRREHDRAVRLVDGRDHRGLVLCAARPRDRDPGLPRRQRPALRDPDAS